MRDISSPSSSPAGTRFPDIPFNKPAFSGNEQHYITQAIANRHISGDGPFTKSVERLLESQLDAPRVLLTSSCTDALELAALLLEIAPGDEVILPAFTFVSTANAFVLRGARPVFVDVRPDTLNLDENALETAITAKTRAIVVVHYAGIGCEMDAICRIAAAHLIPIVEDNAHGLYARYKDRMLGRIGTLATQSFHETKNFTCGEGGAIVVNDETLVEHAEIIREKGTNRSRFFRGQVDKYTWVGLGSSFVLADVLAAFLLAQLESREQIQNTRARIWRTYHGELGTWANKHGVALPAVPPHCAPAYHLYYLLLPGLEERQRFIAYLAERGIASVFHYLPLNRSDMARRLGAETACPVTESVADRLVRLPFYNELREADQARVVEAIKAFRPNQTA